MNDDMPPQPSTKLLPAADRAEIQFNELKVLFISTIGSLDAKVAIGLRDVGTKIDRLEANLELQGGELGIVKKEVGLLFDWKGELDERLKNNSNRARSASLVDLDQAAQLVHEREAREALAAEVATLSQTNALQLVILNRLNDITKNPLVKTIGAMLATAFITWLATKGVKVPQ